MTNVLNILLVDEEELLREATALLLANRGANITKSATIEDALRQLERRTYDVIVVDIPENHPNPARFLELLLAKTSSSARFVVCTEKPLAPEAPTGITQVLVKPYPFGQLIEAIFPLRGIVRHRPRHASGLVTRRINPPRRTPILLKRGRA